MGDEKMFETIQKLLDKMDEKEKAYENRLAAKDELYAKQNDQLQSLIEKLDSLGAAAAAADGDGSGDRRVHHAPPIPAKSTEEIQKEKTTNVYQRISENGS